MRRLKEHKDRGASIVLVAISMTVLIGFTALAVDVGAMWSDKKQLQNGADAGSLALAQICANAMDDPDPFNCNYASFRDGLGDTAESYAAGNKVGGADAGKVAEIKWDLAESRVTVVTERTEAARGLFFAPVLRMNEANVQASATATWGVKTGGQFLPLTFSLCAFSASAGSASAPPTPSTEKLITLYLKVDPSGPPPPPTSTCPQPVGATNGIPGGFGWLAPPSTSTDPCLASVQTSQWVDSKPGGSMNCLKPEELAGPDHKGAIVQIPIFDKCKDKNGNFSVTECAGGSNGSYQITALAAFQITAFCLPDDPTDTLNNTGQYKGWWAADGSLEKCNAAVSSADGNPEGRRLIGYFMGFADNGDGDSNSTPPPKNLGLGIVHLVD